MKSIKYEWEDRIFDNLNDDELLRKIVTFLNSFEGVDAIWSEEYFKWKLLNNPAGNGFLSYAMAGNEIVGTASITLKRLWYKNEVVISGEAGDIYSHPGFRKKNKEKSDSPTIKSESEKKADYKKRSIFGRLASGNTDRALKQGIKIIYGFPNENARPGWENRLDYKVHSIKEIGLLRPTAIGAFEKVCSGTFLSQRPFNLIRTGLTLVEHLLEYSSYKLRSINRQIHNYTIEKIVSLDENVDELWEKAKFNSSLSLVKDKLYFQHRFVDNPLTDYNIYGARRNRELCGILVTCDIVKNDGGFTCVIADWLFNRNCKMVFESLLAHVIHQRYIDNKSYHGFSTWVGSEKELLKVFRKFGFIFKTELPIIFYQNETGRKILDETAAINFTIASSDNI